ncbi:bifunctional 3,4-dihydroxy-2-butanone-4-phosphate synthase/GTP cyclohydrolase II [Acidiferrobacter sp.]|uniref:bifunctional 3,4-dihydroxy-2-butanone-4-phosphate synthase/GTP cyclohydrolase II n=1 Tax=Acidiferrobacter sp. TaxID=1872107 RepID=UPI002604847A|nr:bifunctional 3,4-dihydroxy-2-butanone-4-phosphate synthase/GTP cyclohydrolase II [Acidiferrobacter sp.]
MPISPISEIIDELKAGRMVVIMDDADRENEGDLLMAAEAVTPEAINFMVRHGRGLVCLTLTPERCQRLGLEPMVKENGSRYATHFTASIEAAEGVTTGISAADRAATIHAAIAPQAKARDLVSPGHIFPIMARRGGVLARAGHTEAGVDLARFAGFEPAAVICEILKDDGEMARQPDLERYAAEHQLKIGTIADLIHYRLQHHSSVHRVDERLIETVHGSFRQVSYHDDIEDRVHLALVCGEIDAEPLPVRVHVQESLLDLISEVYAPSWTLAGALRHVAAAGRGVVVLLDQPAPTALTLARLKSPVADPAASASTGREVMRTVGLGSQILLDLGVRKMQVLGHPRKTPGLAGFHLEVVEYVTPRGGKE